MMRVAIYGAGSLGTILGAYISKAGVAIELINRNKAHVEALQTQGAKVVGTVDFTQPVVAYTPAEMSGTYDIIFLMTKQQHNPEVVAMLLPYLAEDGVLVTFQNGLPEVQIAEILGEGRVLGCTVAWGATLQSPGVCELTSAPDALSFSLGSITTQKHKYFYKVKEKTVVIYLIGLMLSIGME
jgi:2-dehydropantoate 2-reductase